MWDYENVWLWHCEFVRGLSECENVGLWECEIVGLWEYGILECWNQIMRMWDNGIVRMWEYEIVRMWDCENVGLWDCANVQYLIKKELLFFSRVLTKWEYTTLFDRTRMTMSHILKCIPTFIQNPPAGELMKMDFLSNRNNQLVTDKRIQEETLQKLTVTQNHKFVYRQNTNQGYIAQFTYNHSPLFAKKKDQSSGSVE